MVFFRKKGETTSTDSTDAGESGKGEAAFQPNPEKASKWFEHGRVAAERYDYDYALYCYANGMRFDPERMSMHEAMYEAAVRYLSNGGKAASNRELRKFPASNAVEKFAAIEFAWMKDINNVSIALKLMDAAINAGQIEFCRWLAPKALNLARKAKRPSKSTFIKAKDLFAKAGAWDEALAAGEDAYRLDPSDNELAAEINDLAAQRAMDQGGYEEATKVGEGGYRKFVKNLDKQKELEEAESISGGSSVEERNFARAKKQYEESPEQPDAINQYAMQLRKRGTPEALHEAEQIYLKGFEATGEYRFRMSAGDIRIELKRRVLHDLDKKLEEDPDSESLKADRDKAREELLDLKSSEYRERVKKYPTDRRMRFELGEVEYELGRYEDAMPSFQAAKDEPKLRVRAAHMLGRCFASEGWHMEAIGEYKESLEKIDATERERELPIRYDLMVSLIEHAREEQSMEMAKEALEICSGIARRDITFRDIRAKRKEIDALIKEIEA